MRTRVVLAVLTVIIFFGWVFAQQENVVITPTDPGVLGAECSVFSFPDAFISEDTGDLMRCDADADSEAGVGRWRAIKSGSRGTRMHIEGTCEAAGPDSGDTCYNDGDCENDAACSGAVCNCIFAAEINTHELYETGVLHAVERYNISGVQSGVYAPYPGVAGGVNNYVINNPSTGANVVEVKAGGGGANLFLGTSADKITANIQGDFTTSGMGTGAARRAGLYQGDIDIQPESASGGVAFTISEAVGQSDFAFKSANDGAGGNHCLEWWDGEASPAKDIDLCRTGSNVLAFSGGEVQGTRAMFSSGDSAITSAQIDSAGNGITLIPPGWDVQNPNDDVGFAMPRNGSLTGVSVMFENSNNGAPAGTLDARVRLAGTPTLLFTCTSGTITSANTVYSWACTQAPGIDTFSAGDMLHVNVIENTYSTGGQSEIIATVEVVLDD